MQNINSNISHDNLKREGLPERIKVTISREDGSPVFSLDKAAKVEYLTEAAPVLVIRRDGGTLETIGGDAHSVGEILQDLVERDRRAADK